MDIISQKRCTKCGEIKPLEAFANRKDASDGRASHCKTCHNALYGKPQSPRQQIQRIFPKDQKLCAHCKEIKPFSEFYRNRSIPDGYAHTCKGCTYSRHVPNTALVLTEKYCTKCGERKPITEFYKRLDSPDGYRNECCTCKNAARYNTQPPLLQPDDKKRCSSCKEVKPVSGFAPCNTDRSGYEPRCRKCRRIQSRDWHRRNKEWVRRYEEEHRDHLLKIRREHNREYRKQPNAIAMRRAREKTAKVRLYNRNRQALRRTTTRQGDVTPEMLQKLLDSQSRCCYCRKLFNSRREKTIDHVIPVSKGGQHVLSNLVVACKPCNSRKHDEILFLL